ncbi:hypothetical protein [Streptomyces sp. NPDC056491]|uniref:hypothetical protein n=1 Tax=Streptomyces sp. NPDC056491 TaxID=3345837 RepID=UPI003673ED5B
MVFRTLVCAAAVVGLVIECAYGSVSVVLSYFTIWTNILVAVVLGLSAARAWRRLPGSPGSSSTWSSPTRRAPSTWSRTSTG